MPSPTPINLPARQHRSFETPWIDLVVQLQPPMQRQPKDSRSFHREEEGDVQITMVAQWLVGVDGIQETGRKEP